MNRRHNQVPAPPHHHHRSLQMLHHQSPSSFSSLLATLKKEQQSKHVNKMKYRQEILQRNEWATVNFVMSSPLTAMTWQTVLTEQSLYFISCRGGCMGSGAGPDLQS